MRLIGCRCKYSDVFSQAVLIGRGLDHRLGSTTNLSQHIEHTLFSFEGTIEYLRIGEKVWPEVSGFSFFVSKKTPFFPLLCNFSKNRRKISTTKRPVFAKNHPKGWGETLSVYGIMIKMKLRKGVDRRDEPCDNPVSQSVSQSVSSLTLPLCVKKM